MLEAISKKITVKWIENGVINKEFEDAYIYGLLLLLSTGINIAVIATISAYMHKSLIWVPFLVGFIPLRITAGGFHAKTPFRCGVFFCGGYTLLLLLVTCMPDSARIIIELISTVVSAILVYKLAPISSSNKPLSDKELLQKRKLSLVIMAIILFLSVFFSLGQTTSDVASMWSVGVLDAAISLGIGKTANAS